MSESREQVELHHAWFWLCDECGEENFERVVVAEIGTQEQEEIAEALGIEPWEAKTGDFYTKPSSVKCGQCGKEYDTSEGTQL